MEENINKITSKLTNVLSQINPNEFLKHIKEAKEPKEYIHLSKQFCELITSVKAQILFDIPDELSSLVKKDKLINETNNSFILNNSNISNTTNNGSKKIDTSFDLKNVLNNFKFKLINLNSNISELNINLNNINGNMKKKKYSLASKRIENLIKLKDKMVLNMNSLEIIKNNLFDNIDKFNISKININKKYSKAKIIQLTKTPSPIRNNKSINNFSTIQLNSKNKNSKKNLSSNKIPNINIKTFKTIESKRTNSSNYMSINTTPSKIKKEIKVNKFNNTISRLDFNKNEQIKNNEKDEIIKKLKSEIDILNSKNKFNEKDSNNNDKNKEYSKINLEKNILLFFNSKLKKISDLIFSITFLIKSLQKKYSQISSQKELTDINNNLMQMTSEINDIRTNIIKSSIENKKIFIQGAKDDLKINENISKEDIGKDFDISLYKTRIKSLQSENSNLKSLIEELNIKISSLNEMISSSKSDNSEINALKEKLSLNEKKIIEMKNIYEADLNSKILIENLLQKSLEEQKINYEEKISKLNKKIEDINRESKIFSMKNEDLFSLKEINSSFANEINSIKNVMISNSNNNSDYNKLKNEINELNEKLSKKDKEIICLITNNNKEKKNLMEKYEKEIDNINNKLNEKNNMNEELNKEINILKLNSEKSRNKCDFENGGNINIKNIKNNYLEKTEINLYIKGKIIPNENENFSDEEDDDITDEEFIIKLKKLNEVNINDNYKIKLYKKENIKLIQRYEDALDENHELKKKMILIEEIVINKQNELYNNLKKGFKDLLLFININNKSKAKIIYFLNLIQFSEQEIKIIIEKKK